MQGKKTYLSEELSTRSKMTMTNTLLVISLTIQHNKMNPNTLIMPLILYYLSLYYPSINYTFAVHNIFIVLPF